MLLNSLISFVTSLQAIKVFSREKQLLRETFVHAILISDMHEKQFVKLKYAGSTIS